MKTLRAKSSEGNLEWAEEKEVIDEKRWNEILDHYKKPDGPTRVDVTCIHFKEEMQARGLQSWVVKKWRQQLLRTGWMPDHVIILKEIPEKPGHYWALDGRHRLTAIKQLLESGEWPDASQFIPSIVLTSDIPDALCKAYGVWINRVQMFANDCSMADHLIHVSHYYDVALRKAVPSKVGRRPQVHPDKVVEIIEEELQGMAVLDEARTKSVRAAVTLLKKLGDRLSLVEILHVNTLLLLC